MSILLIHWSHVLFFNYMYHKQQQSSLGSISIRLIILYLYKISPYYTPPKMVVYVTPRCHVLPVYGKFDHLDS